MLLLPGAKLGPYEILAPIGAGGMGEVYRARDPRLNRDVAIKVSPARFSARSEREAQAVAALNHSHICQIYDVGPDYMVMELIEGVPLQGPLPAEQTIRYALEICGALEAAHAKKITHRDLKPANIMVTAAGVKLLDFGLAKIGMANTPSESTETMGLTQAGTVLGTAAYMSPEQARGEEVDSRSDIFSFGAVLYEMLSGRRAFARNSTAEILSAILRDEPDPIDGPANIIALINRCLRKLPQERFQTMSEVRAAFGQSAGDRPEKVPSVAVLPFANIGADKENEYFSDGLAEEILNLLTKISGLRVIARTSSFAFRGKEQDVTKIAEALRVQNILEGSVRRAGNRIRVTAQLIQAADGTQLWSERYDRDMTDIFAIQDEIGQAISEALQVRLAPRTRVANLEAWQHCLKAEHFRMMNTPEGVEKAKEHFEQAIALDPEYAHAHSGLALCYYVLAVLGVRAASEMSSLAKMSAKMALAIDPADNQSHIVLAVMAGIFDYDWERAERHHLRSLAGGNVPPRARYCYAFNHLVPRGRVAEAIEQSRMAIESDPLNLVHHAGTVWCLYCAGRYAEAIDCGRRAMEISSSFHLLLLVTGLAQLDAGLPDEAVVSFKRLVEGAPWFYIAPGCLAAAYYRAGDRIRGNELAGQFPRGGGLNFGHAIYYAVTGETDAMFEALDGALNRRDIYVPCIRSVALLNAYRADSRFRSLLERMNLTS